MLARMVVVCALGLSVGASANETLRGIKDVRVTISLEENRSTGLSAGSIITDVELELQGLGVPVTDSPSDDYLHISIVILSMNREDSDEALRYVYFVSADYYQRTQIVRENIIITSTSSTWRYSGRLGLADERISETVSEICLRAARNFANDYLKANQRTSTPDE